MSPLGSVPTFIFFTTFPFVIRHTVPSLALATHADPNPHSMSYGWKPTGTRVVTFAVRSRAPILSAKSSGWDSSGKLVKEFGVFQANYGQGPFRWAIYNAPNGGSLLAVSPNFNLPSANGQNEIFNLAS